MTPQERDWTLNIIDRLSRTRDAYKDATEALEEAIAAVYRTLGGDGVPPGPPPSPPKA